MTTIKVYPCSLASDTTFSSDVNFETEYLSAYLEIPTMTSATRLFLEGSSDGTNFYQVFEPPINSATVSCNRFAITTTAVDNGALVPIPIGWKYARVEIQSTTCGTTATLFKFHCK